MLPESTKILSADDHVIEPPGTWVDRVPEKYRARCPRVTSIEGRDSWVYEDEITTINMGNCRPLAGHPEAGYPPYGTANFEHIRPGCYDPVQRLLDMDTDGVWGQLCFPNYARFAGHRFYMKVKDVGLALACVRAYNDFLLDTWCATDPQRLYGAAILPLFDIDEAVFELRRVIDNGAKAVAFSENPTVLGLPSIHTTHWDPLWAIASEAGLPICTHIGSSSRLTTTSDDAPISVMVALLGVNSMMTTTDWVFSGVFERFPALNVILSEGGAGWLPYILERCDKVFHDARLRPGSMAAGAVGRLTAPPTEVFRRHMYACLVDEQFALKSLDFLPVDNVLFEGDYPHGDGLWPNNRNYLEKALASVPTETSVKIAHDNLAALLKV